MNVVITLPRDLIDKIKCGYKTYELRKCLPSRLGTGDGVFVIEKGTDNVSCFFQVDGFYSATPQKARLYSPELGVSAAYVRNYCKGVRNLWLWKIGNVTKLAGLRRCHLCLEKNPQSFAYTLYRL